MGWWVDRFGRRLCELKMMGSMTVKMVFQNIYSSFLKMVGGEPTNFMIILRWTKKSRYLCSIRVEVSSSKALWRMLCAISKSGVTSRQSLCSIFPPLHYWCWKSTLFHIWQSQDWEDLWLFTSCKCVQKPKSATWPTSWLVVGCLCHNPYLVHIFSVLDWWNI